LDEQQRREEAKGETDGNGRAVDAAWGHAAYREWQHVLLLRGRAGGEKAPTDPALRDGYRVGIEASGKLVTGRRLEAEGGRKVGVDLGGRVRETGDA